MFHCQGAYGLCTRLLAAGRRFVPREFKNTLFHIRGSTISMHLVNIIALDTARRIGWEEQAYAADLQLSSEPHPIE
jgi:hypothetical protein